MLRRVALLSVLLFVVFGGGCAFAPLTCPERGGSRWSELGSAHFILQTDLAVQDATGVLEDFERNVRELGELGMEVPAGRRLSVVLFEHEFDYSALIVERLRNKIDGYFTTNLNDVFGRPTIVMHTTTGYATGGTATLETFRHEFTHWVLHANLSRIPKWLDEGLAQFFETLEFDFAAGEVVLGRPPQTELSHQWPPLAEVMSAGFEQFVVSARGFAFYSTAWALVHLLVTSPVYRPGLLKLLEALQHGVPPREAFAACFPGVSIATLEQDLRTQFNGVTPIVSRRKFDMRTSSRPDSVKPMSDAQVHLLWAQLRSWDTPEMLRKAGDDLAAAERSAPESTEVQFWRGRYDSLSGRNAEAKSRFQRLLAAAPEDPRLLYSLAGTLVAEQSGHKTAARDYSEADAVVAKLIVLTPNDSRTFEPVARYYAFRKQPEQGIELARRAVRADPGCWSCFDALAMLLDALHFPAEAVEMQKRAIELLPEQMNVPGLLERLRRYEAAAR